MQEISRLPNGRERFSSWCGQGLPKGWAENMGLEWKDFDGDTVWPIVDNLTCGPIDGFPEPEQMLCWCPSSEKQGIVRELLDQAILYQTEG